MLKIVKTARLQWLRYGSLANTKHRDAQRRAGIRFATVDASKTRMIFRRRHWEQSFRGRCLMASLSGNGQTLLAARIPAPGGNQ